MTDIIHLYDYASGNDSNTCWSYNVWKTRLVLNYKKLPYSTIWLDSETLVPTLKTLGVSPYASDQKFEYTVPTISIPDESVITDSTMIASHLETLHPSPSLHLDPNLQAEANQIIQMTAIPLFAIYMPRLARDILCKRTAPTFIARREKRFGMSFEELEKRGGEQAWKAAEPGFIAWKALLTERKKDEGPFILGSQVCYADFILVALLEAFKRAGDDLFERTVGWDTSFSKLYHASEDWFTNDQ